MQFIRRALVAVVVIALASGAAAWFLAGREAGPVIEIKSPGAFIGHNSSFELFVDAPAGRLTRLTAALTQGGKAMHVFSLDDTTGSSGDVRQASSDRLWVIRPIGKASQPELVAGPATLTVTAARPVLFGWREAESTATKDVTVRLEPPRVGVVSHPSLPEPRRLGIRGAARHAARRRCRREGRGRLVPGLPGLVGRPAGPGAQGGVLRAALRPGRSTRRSPCSPATKPATRPPRTSNGSRSRRCSSARRSRSTDGFLSRVVPAIASNTPSLGLHDRRSAGRLPDHQPRPAPAEQRHHRRPRQQDRARDAVDRGVRAARQLAGGVTLRRSPHLLLRGQGSRPADPSRLRPGVDAAGAGHGGEHGRGRPRRVSRHLRQLRGRRSRAGRAVALRRICRPST